MSETASPSLAPGLEGRYERVVPPEWTLAQFDSRFPAVFSTPMMIGMMEMAATLAAQPALAPGNITLGTRIEVDHVKAVPAGVTVVARATLVAIDGRFLTFEVEARSGETLLGRGRVFRAIVNEERFRKIAAGETPQR